MRARAGRMSEGSEERGVVSVGRESRNEETRSSARSVVEMMFTRMEREGDERGKDRETEVFAKRKERWWRMGGAFRRTQLVSFELGTSSDGWRYLP